MIDKEALERDRERFQKDTIDGQLARLRANLDIVATRISDETSAALARQTIDTGQSFMWRASGIKRRGSAPGTTRTCNPQIRSLMLYPLSYGRVRTEAVAS